jgi:hypothetical protein
MRNSSQRRRFTAEVLPNLFDLIEALPAEIKLMKSADQIKRRFSRENYEENAFQNKFN